MQYIQLHMLSVLQDLFCRSYYYPFRGDSWDAFTYDVNQNCLLGQLYEGMIAVCPCSHTAVFG